MPRAPPPMVPRAVASRSKSTPSDFDFWELEGFRNLSFPGQLTQVTSARHCGAGCVSLAFLSEPDRRNPTQTESRRLRATERNPDRPTRYPARPHHWWWPTPSPDLASVPSLAKFLADFSVQIYLNVTMSFRVYSASSCEEILPSGNQLSVSGVPFS